MPKYMHLFETETEFNEERNNSYKEPWVSYTKPTSAVTYNKSEYEKLLGTPLTFIIQSDGEIRWKISGNSTAKRTIQYSKNGGEWISITAEVDSSAPSISVVSGDTIQFKGNYETYCVNSYYNTFSGTTCNFKVKGNIMSLINSANFSQITILQSADTFAVLFGRCTGLTDASDLLLPATTLTNKCYQSMFLSCTNLTAAPKLPATTLADYCYHEMFFNCTSLTSAPELPATTLEQSCYRAMFSGCTSLTKAPELPATTLAPFCYISMFGCCTSLTTAPELPVTTLYDGCYSYMFQGCTSLINAPVLPATILAESCYANMFQDCTSLRTAPELPATNRLFTYCYENMFYNCTNLNYIKCLATRLSATGLRNPTYNWVYGVASSGKFIKNSSMSGWSTGDSGIPDGWDVQDAS